jgi:hypothetical protein
VRNNKEGSEIGESTSKQEGRGLLSLSPNPDFLFGGAAPERSRYRPQGCPSLVLTEAECRREGCQNYAVVSDCHPDPALDVLDRLSLGTSGISEERLIDIVRELGLVDPDRPTDVGCRHPPKQVTG